MKEMQAFRAHHDIRRALRIRAHQQGYPSVSALIVALCRKDLYHLKDHGEFRKWADLPWDTQDRLDTELSERAKNLKAAA